MDEKDVNAEKAVPFRRRELACALLLYPAA